MIFQQVGKVKKQMIRIQRHSHYQHYATGTMLKVGNTLVDYVRVMIALPKPK